MGFLGDLADIAIRGVVGYASSIPEVKEAAETLAVADPRRMDLGRLFLLPTMCAYTTSRTTSMTSR